LQAEYILREGEFLRIAFDAGDADGQTIGLAADKLLTHDIDVVRAMAHRVLVMKDSAVIESGAFDDIVTHPRSDYTPTRVEAGLS
jgi:ABC-type microcin C transport system duplicated ATPase subunit YejF